MVSVCSFHDRHDSIESPVRKAEEPKGVTNALEASPAGCPRLASIVSAADRRGNSFCRLFMTMTEAHQFTAANVST